MQKWEYLFVDLDWEKPSWRPRHIDGVELREWKKGPSLSEFANQIGREGWELVAVVNYYSGIATIYRMSFKRPVAN